VSPWRALPLLLPGLWLLQAGREAAFGAFSVDLAGHLWMGWSAARGPLTRTALLNWPEGLDLMPVLGGWLDVALVGGLSPALGLYGAYNLVAALYLAVAGWGGAALARAFGVFVVGATDWTSVSAMVMETGAAGIALITLWQIGFFSEEARAS